MIKQEAFKEIEPYIFKYGCYFLCLLFIAENIIKKEIKMQDIVEIYTNCIQNKYIATNCYIYNPVSVLNFVFNFYKTNKKCTNSTVNNFLDNLGENTISEIIEKVLTKYKTTHFVVKNKNNQIVFDPSDTPLKPYKHITYRGFTIC